MRKRKTTKLTMKKLAMMKLILAYKNVLAIGVLLFVSNISVASAAEITFSPQTNANGPSIQLVFEGNVFSSPKNIYEMLDSKVPVEKALATFLNANRIGDKAAFLSSYAPKDQARMKEFVEGDLWEGNVAAFKNETSSVLLATISYGEYVICVVSNTYNNFDGYSDTLFPLIKNSDGKYYITQDLQADTLVAGFGFQLASKIGTDSRQ